VRRASNGLTRERRLGQASGLLQAAAFLEKEVREAK
jgi:hypothetical protein